MLVSVLVTMLAVVQVVTLVGVQTNQVPFPCLDVLVTRKTCSSGIWLALSQAVLLSTGSSGSSVSSVSSVIEELRLRNMARRISRSAARNW